MHLRYETKHTFSLFEKFAGDYKNKKILDYGGNRGNLLYFSQGKIKEENYTCIDVEKDAIRQGKIEFSNANFIHYNRFSPMYNEGNIDEPFPILEEKFDICFAYSVFTHTDFFTFKTTINYLQGICKKLILSFVDNNNKFFKDWVYRKRYEEFGSCLDLNLRSNYYYLIQNNILVNNTPIYHKTHDYFFTFYCNKFLQKIFHCDIILNTQAQDFLIWNNG